MVKPKKKPTMKEMLRMIKVLAIQVENLTLQMYNGDRALDFYMEMNGDKEEFIKYIQKKYDKTNKETEKK